MDQPDVHIFSMWHNEETLAPLFFLHYSGPGTSFHIYDNDSTDRCAAIARENGAEVTEITTQGFDDVEKVKALCAWANLYPDAIRVIVDADEYIFDMEGFSLTWPGLKLYHVGQVLFFQIYEHETDRPIDFGKPPLMQRTHGDPRPGHSYGQSHFCKPIIFMPHVSVFLAPGNHYTDPDYQLCTSYRGAHWCTATTDIALERRLRAAKRMGPANYTHGLTSHNWHITAEQVEEDCESHRKDPVVIKRER